MAKKTTSILTSLLNAALNKSASSPKTSAAAKSQPAKPVAKPPAAAAASGVAAGGNTGEKTKFQPEKIKFGPYDWLILERKDDTALIITEKIVKSIGYHAAREGATWEVSNIRKYLNSTFLADFSPEEQARIIEVTIQNPDNPWYKTLCGEVNAPFSASGEETIPKDPKGGNPTKDKIFCLSLEEACRYFGDSTARLKNKGFTQKGLDVKLDPGTEWHDVWHLSDENNANRTAIMTEKLAAALKRKEVAAFRWWLRSPGGADILAATVTADGKIDFQGKLIWATEQRDMSGVRPVLWLKM